MKNFICFNLLFFTAFFSSFAQSQKLETPLTLEQVEALIKDVKTNENISREFHDQNNSLDIERRGVSFQITDEVLTNLKSIGAGTQTLNALIKIRNTQTNKPKKKLSNNIIILVAKFSEQQVENDHVTDLIINQLRESLKKYPNVSILTLNEHISPREGKNLAIEKGKETDADIVLWGWYKKSSTNVIINYQFEITNTLPKDLLMNTSKNSIEEIPNFSNFSSQLRISKEISLFTLISLAFINFDTYNFEDAIKYATDAISLSPFPNKTVDLSKLYILRAKSSLNNGCNFTGETSLSDVNKAVSLGADPNSPTVLEILALANLQENIEKTIEYAKEYNRVAKTDEDKTSSLFLLMLAYLGNEDEVQTTNFARKLRDHLLVLPDSLDNYLYLALSSYLLQDTVKASVYLDKAKNKLSSNDPQLYRVYHYQGLLYVFTSSYDLAIENFKKVIQMKPACVGEYLMLAKVYEENGNFDSALTTYNQALEINSNIPEIYLSKGRIYSEKNDFERALANYQKAVEIDTKSVESLRALANFYKDRNKINESIETLTKLILLKKNDIEALEIRAVLNLEANNFDLAIADYRDLFPLLAQKTTKVEKIKLRILLLDLNIRFLKKNECDLGIEFSDKYIQFFPDDDFGYKSQADFLEKKGKTDLAIEALTKAIRLNNSESEYYKSRAKLWREKGNFNNAFEDIDQAVRLNKSDETITEERAKVYEERAKYYLENNKYDLALADYRKLVELKPTNIKYILLTLLDNFSERDEYTLELEFSEKYIFLFPNDPYGFYRKANVLELKGEIDLAVESLNKAIELDNENEASLEKRAKLNLQKNKFETAIIDYKNLLKVKAKDKTKLNILTSRSLLRNLSEEFENRKKYELGIEFSSEYIRNYPNDGLGYSIRATFFNDTSNIPNALQDVEQAIKLESKESSHYALRSKIYEKSGDIKSAIASLEKAVMFSSDVTKEIYQSMLYNLRQKKQ